MDISKYMQINKYKLGDIISKYIKDLYNAYKFKNILFIRTCTTGQWLDTILPGNADIVRILYDTGKTNIKLPSHKSTIRISSSDLEKTLNSLNKKFDLICIDTWHEFDVSLRDFTLISSLLNENGMLISHDCYPWNEKVCSPSYINGEWCGQTYIAFVQFAYNNPNMFYSILNTDTGIGIISKKQLSFQSNTIDRKKQEHLFLLQQTSNNPYKYFCENSKEIINAISNYTN